MSIILTVGLLLIIVSYATRKSKYAPLIGFAFVFLIMGFQSGVEGDFMNYKDKFELLARTGHEDAIEGGFEYGWIILRKLFSFGPFWLFILSISLFQSIILCKFTKRYCVNDYQYLAAILFYFTFMMMLWQMKAIRQGLVIEIMLLAFMLVDEKKKLLPPLICALIAFTIHNSCLIIVPFLFLYYYIREDKNAAVIDGRKGLFVRNLPIILTTLYFVVYASKVTFLQQYLAPWAFLMLDDTESRFAGYLEESNTKEGIFSLMGEGVSLLLVFYDAIIVFVVSWFYRFATKRMRLFAIFSIIAAFGDMLFWGLGSLTRLFMYFTVFNIVVYPNVCKQIKSSYGWMYAFIFIVLLIGYAWKTSYPWMIGTDDGRFGTYQFLFWK